MRGIQISNYRTEYNTMHIRIIMAEVLVYTVVLYPSSSSGSADLTYFSSTVRRLTSASGRGDYETCDSPLSPSSPGLPPKLNSLLVYSRFWNHHSLPRPSPLLPLPLPHLSSLTLSLLCAQSTSRLSLLDTALVSPRPLEALSLYFATVRFPRAIQDGIQQR